MKASFECFIHDAKVDCAMQVQFIIFGEMYGNMKFPFFTGLKMLLQQKLSCLLKTGENASSGKTFSTFQKEENVLSLLFSLRPAVPIEICRKAQ